MDYVNAFWVSDAMIVSVHSSDMANYLYTGKPVCIYDIGEMYGLESYQQEVWYKSAYCALEKDAVAEFIDMVGRGEDLQREDQVHYRKCMVKHFDGEVCNRIYDYCEKLKIEERK